MHDLTQEFPVVDRIGRGVADRQRAALAVLRNPGKAFADSLIGTPSRRRADAICQGLEGLSLANSGWGRGIAPGPAGYSPMQAPIAHPYLRPTHHERE